MPLEGGKAQRHGAAEDGSTDDVIVAGMPQPVQSADHAGIGLTSLYGIQHQGVVVQLQEVTGDVQRLEQRLQAGIVDVLPHHRHGPVAQV